VLHPFLSFVLKSLEGAVAVSANLVAEVSDVSADVVASFVTRWQQSAAAERANYQLFLTELCDLIAVPKPEPTKADVSENAYVFERDVTFQNLDGTTSPGRIDLYKRSCFVLEAKQGSEQAAARSMGFQPVRISQERARAGSPCYEQSAVRETKSWDAVM